MATLSGPFSAHTTPGKSTMIATKVVNLRIFIYFLFDMKNRGSTLHLAHP